MQDRYELINASSVGLVKELLDTNLFNEDDICLTLLQAAGNGLLEIVKYLVEEKGQPTWKAIKRASVCGHLDIVKYLAKKNKDVLHLPESNLLSKAAKNRNLAILRYLVEEEGIALESRGEKAMVRAARSGHLDTMKYLIEQKNVSVSLCKRRCIWGTTVRYPLHIVKYLVNEHQLDISVITSSTKPDIMFSDYPLISYFVRKGTCTTWWNNDYVNALKRYQAIETKFLYNPHPLVHYFPIDDLRFKQAEKSKCILRFGVMEMIYCTFVDCPFDIVRVLASVMLGEEFKVEDFYNLALPTPLNLDIDEQIKIYAGYSYKFSPSAASFLALLECNQIQKGV